MLSLCETLGISINELLSGNKLDTASYREKAEENIVTLMQRKSHKKIIIHIGISTAPFLAAFLVFPLAAETIVPPISIPITLFWSILLIFGNLMAGITYGAVKKWEKMRLLFSFTYNVLLLIILIHLFAIASIVFSVS